MKQRIRGYFAKMKGVKGAGHPPHENLFENIFWSWLGGFFGIAAVAWLHYGFLPEKELILIIGSFGASAVLIYGVVKSPFAQPRNLLGGHLISALIGVASYKLCGNVIWLSAALAVATAIAAMLLTKTVHPPGGATALIAVIGSNDIHQLGFFYVVAPVGLGAAVMLLIALLVNNIPKNRRYPEFWF
ncbi:HPP family protein [Candidatus Electronema sp. TJ]|uniref:HPP family protein n=1 Tax=Candidatus Electronema sp. TJ TaxID=3401573 RepID=UPI003AA96CE6